MKTVNKIFFGIFIILTACNNNTHQQAKVDTPTTITKDITKTQPHQPLSGKVEIEKLPNPIKKFIAKNYEGYTIVSAAFDPLCSGVDAVDVSITKKGKPNYSIIFLLDGNFVQQEEDVDISLAPANVLKTVKDKFKDYTIAKQIEILVMADKSIQYLFDISKGNITKEVIVNKEGTIICESKE